MKDSIVKIEGMDYISIVDIMISKCVNEHGEATIKLLVEPEKVDKAMSLSADINWMSIKIGEKEGGVADTIIFTGFIDEISVDTMKGLPILTIKLVGASQLLDIVKATRTYQEDYSKLSKITKEIENSCNKFFPGNNIKFVKGEKCNLEYMPNPKFLVQYRETDYEFLKRCASMQNLPLITVNELNDKEVKINIGFLEGKNGGQSETIHYAKGRQMLKFLKDSKDGNINSVVSDDYNIIKIKVRDYYTLGSSVTVDGEKLYIYSSESRYSSGIIYSDEERGNADEFWHIYQLVPEKRFSVPRIFNQNLAGISLSAIVESVEKAKIKVKCDVDEKSEQKVEFMYASVYSSDDGSGWYSMPEVGDFVRIYLPTEDEKDAYAISSVHNVEGTGLRDNPEHKILMNKYKKEIEFTKESIRLSNNDGMEILLDDNKGISIISSKDIRIDALKSIDIISKSQSVRVSGNDEIKLQSSPSYIKLKNNAEIKGTGVKF